MGRLHSQGLGQHEAEAPVITGISQQDDGGLVQSISGGEHGVHEGVPDAAALMLRQHPKGPEPERSGVLDARAAAHDVANYDAVRLSNDGQTRDDVAVVSKLVNETRFRRHNLLRMGECSGMDGEDRSSIDRRFTSQDHQCSLAVPPTRGKQTQDVAGGGADVAIGGGFGGAFGGARMRASIQRRVDCR